MVKSGSEGEIFFLLLNSYQDLKVVALCLKCSHLLRNIELLGLHLGASQRGDDESASAP